MTVNTQNITSGPYAGNDIVDEFSYTFRVDSKTQLEIFETDDAGAETTLVVDTDYTVAGIGDAGGGLVTRVAGALPTDYEWYIRSNYEDTQETAFASQGGFFPDVHESAMDKITFLIQQLTDRVGRSIRFGDSYSGAADAALPVPEAGKALIWNSAEDGIENSDDTVNGIVASAAASAAAALVSEGAASDSADVALVSENAAAASAAEAAVSAVTWVEGGWVTATAYTAASPRQALNHGTKKSSYVCILDHTAATTSEPGVGATWETYWEYLAEAGDGDVSGPVSAVGERVAVFDGVTGKLIKDGGTLLSALARLVSPVFTGNPSAPTQTAGNNSTRLATTEFVQNAKSDYILLEDQKSSGSYGGTFTQDAWQKRDLEEQEDDGDLCSVVSSVITLAAGTYRVRGSAPALQVNSHQCRLRNTSGTPETLLVGSTEHTPSAAAVTTTSTLSGTITIAASQELKFEHRCDNTVSTNGWGEPASFGEVEVYSRLEFWKIA